MSQGTQNTQSTDEKESVARAVLPYLAEYCKTSRAKCKKCSEPMTAGSLKIANMVKSRWHDGHDANFHHVTCFFQIKRPSSVAEISHFEKLKYEDQKMLEKAVETKGLSVLGTQVKVEETKSKSGKKGEKSGKKRSATSDEAAAEVLVNYDDYPVEYAKSGRAKCKKCEGKIEKDSIRVGKMDYDAETPYNIGPVPRWYHVQCFAESVEKFGFYGQVSKLKGFSDLEEEDRKMLKKKIKPATMVPIDSEAEGKKMKKEDAEAAEKEEKALKKQSDRFFALRALMDSMKRKDLEDLMQHMRQKSNFRSPSSLVDMATDVMMFGPIAKCPTCNRRGYIELRGGSYICTNLIDEQRCTYETRDPKRGVPDVPEDIEDKYSFLTETYKFIGGKRIFPTKFVQAVERKEAEDNNLVQEGAPLDGLMIGVISWNSVDADKTKIKKAITVMGGKLLTFVEKSILVILSNEDEISRNTPKVEVAKALNIPFAKPDFIFKIKTKEDLVPQLKSCLLGEWDGDLEARVAELRASDKKS